MTVLAPAVTLYGYQQRWLTDKARFKIGMFARQTGKTFTTTLEIVDECVEQVISGLRESWVILSRGERQAREAMEEGIKRHLAAYQMGFEAEEMEAVFGESRVTQLEVTLPNGARITALPANPDTARGFSRNVFLDEFAIHKDSRAIWGALFPIVSNGYKLRVTSTPKGKGNKFYELMTGNDRRWSRHTVTILQAVAEGLPRDVEELREALGDEELWAQEYMLEFLDEATAWLTFELIASCEHDDACLPDLYKGGPCYMGVDIGRRRDLFVADVYEEVEDLLVERERVELKGASFAEQDEEVDRLFRTYRILRSCWDQTGMGEKPVEDAQRRYGTSRVEGVLMSPSTQLRLATVAKERFEDRRIRIEMGNPHLRGDLHKIRKEVGPTGIPRFVADRDSNGHADRAWACFLAMGAAGVSKLPIGGRGSGVKRLSSGIGDFVRGG